MLHAAGREPRWLWQGQKASAELREWLRDLGAGGGTPLPEALAQASDWLQRRQRLKPGENQRLLILTDGRLDIRAPLLPPPCPALLVDIESGPVRLGRARLLAEQLGAEYHSLGELPPR